MNINGNDLREQIILALKIQGFSTESHLTFKDDNKKTIRLIHAMKRREQLKLHKRFLIDNIDKIKSYSTYGGNLDPKRIDLRLIEVRKRSDYSKFFFWWNLIWWSIPYDRPIGRQMRFILWDDYHDMPFGLFCLQSPPLRSGVRDQFLGLNSNNVEYWINQSLYGQRIGALPPYNELLGGKMVALSLVSDEVRNKYSNKYHDKTTILKKRTIPSDLLFITTTSAFGRSSIYERIKYNGENISQFIGFTSGNGTFHIPEDLYLNCINYLNQKGIDTRRGYGTRPSRKMKLLEIALRQLKISKFRNHNIKRGYYIFKNIKNLHEVIHEAKNPIWCNRPLHEMAEFWLNRWCIPRSQRIKKWETFDPDIFFKNVMNEVNQL